MNLRQAAQQALQAMQYAANAHEFAAVAADLAAALAEPEQKVWCDCGDSIEPDSGAKCGNCVAGDSAEPEQEPDTDCHAQGICQRSGYSIAPTPRKPLSEAMKEQCPYPEANPTLRGAFYDGWMRAEAAHGIGEQHE